MLVGTGLLSNIKCFTTTNAEQKVIITFNIYI